MRYIADLHIHSPYSRATSKASHLHGLAAWAAVKGIQVVGTGDFTHSGWLGQISEHLEEAEPGFYRLRSTDQATFGDLLPPGLSPDLKGIRFVLTAEISSIYKRGGRVRKVHNILFAPDLAAVRGINATLAGIGNLESDGRPILGLDSRDLLEIVLEKAPDGFLVPAHIWTPWFSLFGSKSGFDAVEECFGDLAHHVFALETGLSSDPDMNRLISALDRFSLISNSDCHSPGKLGREANIFSTRFDYFALRDALRATVDEEGRQRFEATVEFFPEEGKYHGDGHRKCGVSLEPDETRELDAICPVCGRPLTVGVLNRVMELADRDRPLYPKGAPAVHSLVPLPEILSELLGVGPATKKVTAAYAALIRKFGSEFAILLDVDTGEIEAEGGAILAEAVHRVRSGKVIRKAGYDGEFGTIKVFTEQERQGFGGQQGLFVIPHGRPAGKTKKAALDPTRPSRTKSAPGPVGGELNPEQERVVASSAHHIIVKAGPGTGKTHSLVQRVVRMAAAGKKRCTVITFTNRAADELTERIQGRLGNGARVTVTTLHGFCLKWLRRANPSLAVAGPETRLRMLRSMRHGDASAVNLMGEEITRYLQDGQGAGEDAPRPLRIYFDRLIRAGMVDIDGVVPAMVAILRKGGLEAEAVHAATGFVFVDEFQDVNRSQYELVRLLGQEVPVFVIGDPDQAIYGFRGASPQWFYRFMDDLHPEQHQLHRNYRNGFAIVNAASAVIANNPQHGFPVRNESMTGTEGCIYQKQAKTPRDEARFVVRQIERLIGGSSHREIDRLRRVTAGDLGLKDVAVLYRTGRQAGIIAETLTEHGFPIQVVDVTPFYLREPVLPLYCWLMLIGGEASGEHLQQLLSRELGSVALADEIMEHLAGTTGDQLTVAVQGVLASETDGILGEITRFRESMLRKARQDGLGSMLEKLVERCGLGREHTDTSRLFALAENFNDAAAFASHLQRFSESVVYDDRAEAVTLMTLHASKGLEFRAVFIVGVEEGLIPLAPRTDLTVAEEARHLEEERRLFYVGLTRARDILYLCHTTERMAGGELVQQGASRFFQEIPSGIVSTADTLEKGTKRRARRGKQLRLFD